MRLVMAGEHVVGGDGADQGDQPDGQTSLTLAELRTQGGTNLVTTASITHWAMPARPSASMVTRIAVMSTPITPDAACALHAGGWMLLRLTTSLAP